MKVVAFTAKSPLEVLSTEVVTSINSFVEYSQVYILLLLSVSLLTLLYRK